MDDDLKIASVKDLIASGRIKVFSDIFRIVAQSAIADKLGVKYQRFLDMVKNPIDFRYSETAAMAEIFGIPPLTISQLIHAQLDQMKATGK